MIRIYFLLFAFLIFGSCSSKKNILYIQNSDNSESYVNEYSEYRLKSDDVLKIDVSVEVPESAMLLNKNVNSVNNNPTKESLIFSGYIIDSDGYINYPSLGKIHAKGKTLNKLSDHISELLISNEILKNPVIDVKLLNASFTILGEVNNPGKYDFIKNNMNVLEAIGMAGDLSITGDRKDIKVIRDDHGVKNIYSIDLTQTNFIDNNNYQIFSGDVIIVNPNITKIKNAGIIGNSGTLLSLLSFILSSIIVISN